MTILMSKQLTCQFSFAITNSTFQRFHFDCEEIKSESQLRCYSACLINKKIKSLSSPSLIPYLSRTAQEKPAVRHKTATNPSTSFSVRLYLVLTTEVLHQGCHVGQGSPFKPFFSTASTNNHKLNEQKPNNTQCNTIRYITRQNNTIQNNITQHNTTETK